MTRNKWGIAIASASLHLCVGSVYAWSVLVKPIVESCGFSTTTTTFIFSLAIFFLGCGASVAGKWVDIYGAKKVGFIASIVFMLGYFISALAINMNSIMLLYLGYGILVGSATGGIYVTPISTLIKYFYKTPGVAGAICIASFGLSATIASVVMNYLVSNFGLMENFIILGICYGIIMIPSSFYFAPPNEEILKEATKDIEFALPPEKACKTWQFKALFITFFFNIGAGISILALLALILQDDYGFTALEAALFVSLASIANSSGRFIWAGISDWIGCPNIYVFFALLGAIMYNCIATIDNVYVFEGAVLTIISLYGGFFSAMPSYLNTLFSKKYLSTIHGKILFAWGLAGIFFPIMLSYCKDLLGTYTPILYLFVVMMLINLFLLWDIRKDVISRDGDFIHEIQND